MAGKDSTTKKYMSDNEVFADAFNFYIYGGEQVIKSDQLRTLDTTAITLPYKADKSSKPIQKHRDILKLLTVMTDDKAAYVVFGAELQSQIHDAMPVRNMLYDAIQYSDQVHEICKAHKKNNDKPDTSGEFLSQFHKDDKLIPVITLVIYLGPDEWDAPMSVHEMLEVKDQRILKYVQDYRLNVIAPASIPDEDFEKFHTELKQALKYVKYSSNKELLKKMVEEDESFKHLSWETANMINQVTGSKMKLRRSKGEVNVCKAIQDIKADGILEGIEIGRAELINSIKSLMTKMNLSADEAMEILDIPEDKRESYKEMIENKGEK